MWLPMLVLCERKIRFSRRGEMCTEAQKQQLQCLNNVTSKMCSPQSDHLISRLYLAKTFTLSISK